MKISNLCLLVFWISLISVASCARRGVPTGGPKDTIPPSLISMNPELETVNFDENELVLEFDEFIQARSLKQDLIINPPIEDYDFYVNRRSVVIEINDELEENTTYTFNFRDAIKDVSEQNPAENVVMAFSTGSKIDSFQVQGKVTELFTNETAEDVLVALYPESDTLSPFEDPPTYLTKTDEEGNYAIRYIRVGTYKVFAFKDANNNLKIDSNNEPFGFEAEPVVLLPEETEPIIDSLTAPKVDTVATQQKVLYGTNADLRLFQQDVRPISIQSSRPNGKYYEIKINKSLKDYELIVDQEDLQESTLQYLDSLNPELPKDTTRFLYSNFLDQQKTIRIYNTIRQDSIRAFLVLNDSVDHTQKDTLYIKFEESRREAEVLKQSISAKGEIQNTVELKIKFNKPITQVKTDSILLSYDTLFYIPLRYDTLLKWNKRLDEVNISRRISKNELVDTLMVYKKVADSLNFIQTQRRKTSYLDSLQAAQNLEEQLSYFEMLAGLIRTSDIIDIADSINNLNNSDQQSQLLRNLADTLNLETSYQPKTYNREELLNNLKPLVFYLAPGSFISVEQDSSQQILQRYSFKNPSEYGTITGNINTNYESYTIQLLDKSYKVVAETQGANNQFAFSLIPPGEYKIRVLIDEDLDGIWEKGNVLTNKVPEPIFFYTAEDLIELRANWERDINLRF